MCCWSNTAEATRFVRCFCDTGEQEFGPRCNLRSPCRAPKFIGRESRGSPSEASGELEVYRRREKVSHKVRQRKTKQSDTPSLQHQG